MQCLAIRFAVDVHRLQIGSIALVIEAYLCFKLLIILYRFVMRTMVDQMIESEADLIMLVDTKPIGLVV